MENATTILFSDFNTTSKIRMPIIYNNITVFSDKDYFVYSSFDPDIACYIESV